MKVHYQHQVLPKYITECLTFYTKYRNRNIDLNNCVELLKVLFVFVFLRDLFSFVTGYDNKVYFLYFCCINKKYEEKKFLLPRIL